MRLTRTITMEGRDRVPVTASVITGDDKADLPIRIKQDAHGSGASQIYMDWEQWRHVCQLIDSNAPARTPHCLAHGQREDGVILNCTLSEGHHWGASGDVEGWHVTADGDIFPEQPPF